MFCTSNSKEPFFSIYLFEKCVLCFGFKQIKSLVDYYFLMFRMDVRILNIIYLMIEAQTEPNKVGTYLVK